MRAEPKNNAHELMCLTSEAEKEDVKNKPMSCANVQGEYLHNGGQWGKRNGCLG